MGIPHSLHRCTANSSSDRQACDRQTDRQTDTGRHFIMPPTSYSRSGHVVKFGVNDGGGDGRIQRSSQWEWIWKERVISSYHLSEKVRCSWKMKPIKVRAGSVSVFGIFVGIFFMSVRYSVSAFLTLFANFWSFGYSTCNHRIRIT